MYQKIRASHNFFKLRLDREKSGVSVQDLLKKELLLALALYQQKFDVNSTPPVKDGACVHFVKIEQSRATIAIENKIAISNYQNSYLSLEDLNSSGLASRNLVPILYSCPLGLSLATTLQQSPAIIVKRLGNLLNQNQEYNYQDIRFELLTETFFSGWINFYLDSQFVASWLTRLFCWSISETTYRKKSAEALISPPKQSQANLFTVQYLHARCCSLLALGAREKLLILTPECDRTALHIQHPELISWLDDRDRLWFTRETEYNLLRQLLIVTDAWVENNKKRQWSKLAIGLSQATDIFLADCRFLGSVRDRYPQLAIARLGLIALVQLWLEKILVEKLGMTAPKSM